MSDPLNPQARQMADESMVRNLAAQADAIWPQEILLVRRYGLPAQARILDAGCGTGEATLRLAEELPGASVLGVDVLDPNLALARTRTAHLAPRVQIEHRSIFTLDLAPGTFDLTVCRHVLQSIPRADDAIAELVRVTRRGGRIHLVAEDYGMIHFPRRRLDPDAFWPAVVRFGEATGTDMRIGRRAPGILRRLGLERVAVDHVVVDTLRVPRERFAAIWEAWRDGYADALAEHGGLSRGEVVAHFDDQLATLRDPASYAAWIVPVVSGVVA